MPLLTPQQLPSIFEDVMHGRKKLVVWGVTDIADIYRWTCPLPVAYFVDTEYWRRPRRFAGLDVHSPSRLEQEDPAGVVVALNYHLSSLCPQLAAYLDGIGPVGYFHPIHLDRVWRGQGTGDLAELVARPWRDAGSSETETLARAFARTDLGEGHWPRAGRLLAAWRRHHARQDQDGPRSGAVLVLEALYLGGAERQLCNLGMGLRRRGFDVTLAVTRAEAPGNRHYVDFLIRNGIAYHPVSVPGLTAETAVAAIQSTPPEVTAILWHLPPYLVTAVLALYLFLCQRRPRLVVCHLDRPNLMGAFAALLAGVPAVLMSGRNVNPTHFPHFYAGQTDDMAELYRVAIANGARLYANTANGAQSYARWLDLAADRVPVVANCVSEAALTPLAPAAAMGVRAMLELPADARLVLGVFRLSPEKRPLLFVETLARLLELAPDVHGVICGLGNMEGAVQERARALGIAHRLTLAGAVGNIPAVMGAADLLLHTAQHEGMPNVLLEAQAQGLPIVCCDAPGSAEALAPVWRETMVADPGPESLARACLSRLGHEDDDDTKRRVSVAKTHVRTHHSIDRLAAATLDLAFPSPDATEAT